MKKISFWIIYQYSLLSISVWSLLYILLLVFPTPRGKHINEYQTYIVVFFCVVFLSFLMSIIYNILISFRMSHFKRNIIFVILISYFYLPFSILSIYKDNSIHSLLSIDMIYILFNIKIYLLGLIICPAPILFVYLIKKYTISK